MIFFFWMRDLYDPHRWYCWAHALAIPTSALAWGVWIFYSREEPRRLASIPCFMRIYMQIKDVCPMKKCTRLKTTGFTDWRRSSSSDSTFEFFSFTGFYKGCRLLHRSGVHTLNDNGKSVAVADWRNELSENSTIPGHVACDHVACSVYIFHQSWCIVSL